MTSLVRPLSFLSYDLPRIEGSFSSLSELPVYNACLKSPVSIQRVPVAKFYQLEGTYLHHTDVALEVS